LGTGLAFIDLAVQRLPNGLTLPMFAITLTCSARPLHRSSA
jgi:hypothetical protein